MAKISTSTLRKKLLELTASRYEIECKHDYADLVEDIDFRLLVAQINWIIDRLERVDDKCAAGESLCWKV